VSECIHACNVWTHTHTHTHVCLCVYKLRAVMCVCARCVHARGGFAAHIKRPNAATLSPTLHTHIPTNICKYTHKQIHHLRTLSVSKQPHRRRPFIYTRTYTNNTKTHTDSHNTHTDSPSPHIKRLKAATPSPPLHTHTYTNTYKYTHKQIHHLRTSSVSKQPHRHHPFICTRTYKNNS
jgi:hypothetical protein